MTKTQLIKQMAVKMESTQKDAEKALSAFLESVVETLSKGEDVNLVGFGKFYVKERASRIGRNPQTGEEIQIPACKVPSFKAGKGFGDTIKNS